MGLIMKSFITLFMIVSLIYYAEAAWQGQTNVVSLGWGSQPGQVAIRYGDIEDSFPSIFQVDQNGNILIADSGNVRLQIFSSTGTLIKSIGPVGLPVGITGWPLGFEIFSGAKILIKRGDKYQIYDYSGNLVGQFTGVATYVDEMTVLQDDSIIVYKSDERRFYQYSSTGQLIKTSTAGPLELGVVHQYGVGRTYRIKVTYPDNVYQFTADQPLRKYYRDTNQNLFQVETFTETVGEDKFVAYKVNKYDRCSKKVSVLNLPRSQYEPMPPEASDAPTWKPVPIMEYGEPLVSSAGDVYAWARTKTQYKILKWTWVDDPNVPTGPDAPTGLSVAASINGLYLTWTASPNDPGCVTGYEVARATSAGGVYSTVETVEKGVIKYNDTTAEAGTMYYYKVRAKAGSEPSPYTAEVSGKR